MLPKIPYSMQKNKSMTVPIGNLNFSSNFKPGDIADSYGISARQFPRLTNNKAKELTYQGGKILGMTVFNGEIVTVRATGDEDAEIYAGDNKVASLSGDYPRRLAVINTKLVVYPDKVYIEKADGEWDKKNLGAIIKSNNRNVFFTQNTIAISSSFKQIEGEGGKLEKDNYKKYIGKLAPNPTNLENATYMFEKNGYVTTVQYYGKAKVTCKNGNLTIKTEDNSKKITDGARLCCFTENVIYEVLTTKDGITDDGIRFTVTGMATSSGSLLDVAELDCQLYYAKTDSRFSKIVSGKNVSITDENNNVIIEGKADIVNYSSLGLTMSLPNKVNKILTGSFTVNYFGFKREDVEQLSRGDIVRFENSDQQYTISVDVAVYSNEKFELIFEEPVKNIISTDTRVTIIKSTNNFSRLKRGDAVVISGSYFATVDESGKYKQGGNDLSFIISDIKDDILYASADIFTPHTYEASTSVTIERRVPELDFICEKDNRIYGVSNAEKTVYVSALGDPTNMYTYEGVSTDSFAVAVGGEGDFTGCCKYAESVIFFKEDKIYKLTGSYPADFALYSYDVDGLECDSEKSTVIINEVLYYKGKNGIFAYTGGIPTLISDNFGEKNSTFFEASAGTDGVNYYLIMYSDDGMTRLFCYNTRLGIWTQEDKTEDTLYGFVRTPDGLYIAYENGNIYRMNASNPPSDCTWMTQFTPLYETIEGKKVYSRLVMRAEIPKGSHMIIEVRSDDGPWCEAGKIVGVNKGIIPIRLPIARCDKFEIRLRGKGEFVLHEILREYHVGSEV